MVAKLHDFCTIDGCGKLHVARGYCDAHYRAFRKYGDPLHRVLLDSSVPCLIPDCGRRRQALGFCHRHYAKLKKYGDPLYQRHANHGDPLSFLRAQLATNSDECVLWPFAQYSSGYGSVWHEGRLTGAHRLICRLAHGEPPRAALQAAHRCGQKLCVNHRHLRWATQTENEADKLLHGTDHRRFRMQRFLEGAI